MAEREDRRESYPDEDAFQVAGHDADSGVGLQDGFAEQAIVQEEGLE